MGLIYALGIDGRILLAQLFNFAILVFILWRFAYKPVLNILEERRLKVEKSLDDAEAATKRLKQAEAESKKILSESRKEASKIIEAAQIQAEERQKEVVRQAEADIEALINKERGRLVAEKTTILVSLKKEVSSLLLAGLKKFLDENIDDKKDQAVIEKIIKNLGE
jgi:F-type H+-transporting ATPase subunit b